MFYNNLTDDGYKLYGAKNRTVASEVPLNNFLGEANALTNLAAYNEDPSWPLKKGYAAVYKIEVKMSPESGNNYANAEWKGNIVVDAVQSEYQLEEDEGEILEKDEVQW